MKTKDETPKKKKGGRPKGSFNWTTAQARMIKEFQKSIKKNWKKIIDTNLYLALGQMKYNKVNGKRVMVYTTAPDRKTLEFLTAHIVGKPKETVELNAQLPVSIEVVRYKSKK